MAYSGSIIVNSTRELPELPQSHRVSYRKATELLSSFLSQSHRVSFYAVRASLAYVMSILGVDPRRTSRHRGGRFFDQSLPPPRRSHIHPFVTLPFRPDLTSLCVTFLRHALDVSYICASKPKKRFSITLVKHFAFGSSFFIRIHVALSPRINRTCEKKNGSKTEHVRV